MIDRSLCPCCGAAPDRTLTEIPFADPSAQTFFEKHYGERMERNLLDGGSYVLLHCRKCGLIWQRWILDDHGMERLYGTWIDPQKSSAKRLLPQLRLQYARHAARMLRLFPSPWDTAVLDYGMGWGEWCEMAQAFGFKVHGVELSEERVARARSRGIGASSPKEMPAGPYDYIYMEQVLEHVPRPGETLRDLLSKLKPGGYIHIGVPDGSRTEATVHDRPLLLAKGPSQPLEHINIFTPAALKAVMAMHGCLPAKQQEGLIRTKPLGTFVSDVALWMLRSLPASVFPPGTSLLFRKTQ